MKLCGFVHVPYSIVMCAMVAESVPQCHVHVEGRVICPCPRLSNRTRSRSSSPCIAADIFAIGAHIALCCAKCLTHIAHIMQHARSPFSARHPGTYSGRTALLPTKRPPPIYEQRLFPWRRYGACNACLDAGNARPGAAASVGKCSWLRASGSTAHARVLLACLCIRFCPTC